MTYCPTCGKVQSHNHLGWLSLEKNPDLKNTFTEQGVARNGVLFTQVICDTCGVNTIMIRFMPEESRAMLGVLEEAIRTVFEEKEIHLYMPNVVSE